jgi:hypothetical protein
MSEEITGQFFEPDNPLVLPFSLLYSLQDIQALRLLAGPVVHYRILILFRSLFPDP